MALSNAAAVRIFSGVKSSHTISTARRPAAAHIRGWLESGAGIDEAPGSASPSASVIAIIVAAVPIAMIVEHHLDLVGEKIRKRWRRAPIRHVHKLDARHHQVPMPEEPRLTFPGLALA